MGWNIYILGGILKILGICGSPRKGNTETILKTILESAKEKGAEYELLLLKDIKMNHCAGCSVCNDTRECVIVDDMGEIIKKVEEADLILFGSPTYFDDVSGIMKDFIDRLHPEYKKKALKGKKFAIAVIGLADEESVGRTAETIKIFGELMEMDFVGQIVITGDKIQENLDKLKEFGEKISK